VHRKLLYSVLVLVLSAVLAASAFAQETTDQESETGDINREVVVDDPLAITLQTLPKTPLHPLLRIASLLRCPTIFALLCWTLL
jgi:hypothetical protein